MRKACLTSGLFGTSTANTSSISNQRGEELYKTAASRCKSAVLNDCSAQGGDIAVITNSYDLRGCVNALDSCMQDDFVCGSDYENCLDPSGKYIVDGEVVIGSMPGRSYADDDDSSQVPETCNKYGLYATWSQNGTENDSETHAWCSVSQEGGTVYGLNDYIDGTLNGADPTKTSPIMSRYLLNKIGYIEDGKAYGMCASVLNKCQNYTYEDGTYIKDNSVVKEFLRRTLTAIKVAQDDVIANYAENCVSEVTSCLNQNNYTTSSNIAINACRSSIITCMSVNGNTNSEPAPGAMKEWVEAMFGNTTSE